MSITSPFFFVSFAVSVISPFATATDGTSRTVSISDSGTARRRECRPLSVVNAFLAWIAASAPE